MKTKVRRGINAIMAFALSLFGFGSCNFMKYGTPYASLEVSGQITDTEEEPLEDIRVIVKNHTEYSEQQMLPRTYTNQFGEYDEKNDGVFPVDNIDIIVEDPSGFYERDSVRVKVEYKRERGSSSWDYGDAHIQQNFQLKKK